uniref:PUM-HD domain-containing protein n=1 Tax=Globodera rostochiensis TaxID=31243 RepID=A0A914HY78_GLORO
MDWLKIGRHDELLHENLFSLVMDQYGNYMIKHVSMDCLNIESHDAQSARKTSLATLITDEVSRAKTEPIMRRLQGNVFTSVLLFQLGLFCS